MRAAAPDDCRLLELGCGDGGNLLPMALTLPQSTFVGVDLSPSAIARGRDTAAALGLDNVTLVEGDLAALPGGLGTFDYVVSHGVYSWVPDAAREGLMAACGTLLEPHGIAYVSYNAYPGSHLRDMARGMLQWHVRGIDDPAERIAAARSLMELVVAVGGQSPYARVLREHAERMLEYGDALLFHDDLAPVSRAFYFHEFMAHAALHGLRFVAEADMSAGRIADVPVEAARELERLGEPDVVLREQYMDFVRNRMFRQTLLCRREVGVEHALSPGDLADLFVASQARPDPEDEWSFKTSWSSLSTREPIVRGAMDALAEAWPRGLRFDALLDAARARAASRGDVDRVVLGDAVLRAHLADVVELHTIMPPLVSRPGPRPCASPLARLQAERGDATVTTLRHTTLNVENRLARRLITLVDGTRDRDALVEALRGAEAEPGWTAPAEEDLPGAIDDALERLCRAGLLLA